MNNEQVAHLWANRARDSASGSHLYFRGDTIYSYGAHFPIARHCQGVVLFTTQGYSNSTARHKSHVRHAISGRDVFFVDNPSAYPSGADVNAYAERIKRSALSAGRARNPTINLACLEGLIAEANQFCCHFGFKTRFNAPDNIEELRVKARESAAREQRKAQARRVRLERESKAAIARWLEGENISIPYGIDHIYLREFQGKLQTSRGAQVPMAEAEKAFRFITKVKEQGWRRNGGTFKVGDFQLDSVSTAGVVAGCHHIHWDEIDRFAKAQGWIE